MAIEQDHHQVLDESSDLFVEEMVEQECRWWESKGVRIEYAFRIGRSGYKYGALREGLEKPYAGDWRFVAIFDAGFQPDLALVQAIIMVIVVNADECMLTHLQEMSLDYHFCLEQEVGSSTYTFFRFNGTAGAWRMQALANAGGWKDQTAVGVETWISLLYPP